MLRETKVFECFSADDIYDAVEYANNRTDGGKTIIKLYPAYAPYIMNGPLNFTKSYGDIVEMDFNGLTIINGTSENDWKIGRGHLIGS